MKWLLLGLGTYGLICLYMYLTQERQIFNYRALPPLPAFTCKGCETLSLEVEPGVFLKGKGRFDGSGPLLLYFGGNADDATRILLHVDAPVNIVAFNYRGYVDSGGQPSQRALFEDALRIYDTYASQTQIVVLGRSLGTGVATYLASKRPVSGLVLITPFDSIRALAKASFPFLPIDWLLQHPFDSDQHIKHVSAPVFILEVEGDNVTPKPHLEALKAKVPHLQEHRILHHTTHGEVLTHENFSPSLLHFLDAL